MKYRKLAASVIRTRVLQSPSKSNFSFEEHQQFINRIEAKMSAMTSHIKCELSTMSIKIDSTSEFVNTKINNLNDQQRIIETLRENIKFLQMEPETKNDIIKNLLGTQSTVTFKSSKQSANIVRKTASYRPTNKVSDQY